MNSELRYVDIRPRLGDKVYFYPKRKDESIDGSAIESTDEGTVICIFTSLNSKYEQFVIEIPTHSEPTYVVRDIWTLGLTPNAVGIQQEKENS
jgi:hypothetical protein